MADSSQTPQKLTVKGWFSYRRGPWWPAWALLMLPFLFVFLPLYRFVKDSVHWKAAWLTVFIVEILLMSAEMYSLKRGHWVYNEARIWGPKIFGVPIEEPLLYYLFSPLIIICLFHAVLKFLNKRHQ